MAEEHPPWAQTGIAYGTHNQGHESFGARVAIAAAIIISAVGSFLCSPLGDRLLGPPLAQATDIAKDYVARFFAHAPVTPTTPELPTRKEVRVVQGKANASQKKAATVAVRVNVSKTITDRAPEPVPQKFGTEAISVLACINDDIDFCSIYPVRNDEAAARGWTAASTTFSKPWSVQRKKGVFSDSLILCPPRAAGDQCYELPSNIAVYKVEFDGGSPKQYMPPPPIEQIFPGALTLYACGEIESARFNCNFIRIPSEIARTKGWTERSSSFESPFRIRLNVFFFQTSYDVCPAGLTSGPACATIGSDIQFRNPRPES